MYQTCFCSNPATRTRSSSINPYFLWHNADLEQRLRLLGIIKTKHCKKNFFVKSRQRIYCFELSFNFLEIKQISVKWKLSKPIFIFMGLAEAEGLKSSYEGKLKLKWGSHKFQVDNFYEGVDPQLFYQNCLPISASFGVKICTTICLE